MRLDLEQIERLEAKSGLTPYQQCWISAHYLHDYKLDDVCKGTYGLVLLFSKETNPTEKLAAKTVDLMKYKTAGLTDAELENFQREIGIWLNMPPHDNVVRAIDLRFLPLTGDDNREIGEVPLVKMPFCPQSLRDWIKHPDSYSELDRYVAVGHFCNGLSWLYKHGVLGHGDLKPENVLVRDLRDKFPNILSEPGWPKELGPWLIRVADLGWANAWVDLGYTDRAWLPYIAPERYEGRFVPVASDMFAVGIIIAELFLGIHPAGGSAEEQYSELRKLSRSKRPKWARSLQDSSHLTSWKNASLRELVRSCLAPDPAERPTPDQIINWISECAKTDYNFDVQGQCYALTGLVEKGDFLHAGWAPHQVATMGDDWRDKEIASLKQQLADLVDATDPENLSKWLVVWKSLVTLLSNRSLPEDQDRIRKLGLDAVAILEQSWNHDLRPYFYPLWSECSLDSREILYDYSSTAIALLKHDPKAVENLRKLQLPIEEMYTKQERRHKGLLEEFIVPDDSQ